MSLNSQSSEFHSRASDVEHDKGRKVVVAASVNPLRPPPTVDDKAMVRKIDRKVVPILFLMFFVAFLDRVGIGNALVMSLPKDLDLTGNQINTVLVIFFVPYIIFEIPSNMMIKRVKPHNWLTFCIISFGIVMLAQGFVKDFGSIVTTRFLLGLFEAGVLPGSFYLLSFWYAREEAQKRFTIYWCSVISAVIFGGLIATGISKMDGTNGLANWRWIFIIEGLLTIVVGVTAWFFVVDFPDQVDFLTPEEKAWLLQKTGRDQQPDHPVTVKDLPKFFSNPQNVLGALLYFFMVVPIYAFSYFGPTIVGSLGYSVMQTQLHAIPPAAAALALALLLAWASDYTRVRLIFVYLCYGIILIGAVMLLVDHHTHFAIQYAALHLVAMGAFAGGPLVICWYVMNLQGHVERSIGAAFLISFGNTGGIVATYAFLSTDAPDYKSGYKALVAILCVAFLATTGYLLLAISGNKNNKKVTDGGKVFHQSL